MTETEIPTLSPEEGLIGEERQINQVQLRSEKVKLKPEDVRRSQVEESGQLQAIREQIASYTPPEEVEETIALSQVKVDPQIEGKYGRLSRRELEQEAWRQFWLIPIKAFFSWETLTNPASMFDRWEAEKEKLRQIEALANRSWNSMRAYYYGQDYQPPTLSEKFAHWGGGKTVK